MIPSLPSTFSNTAIGAPDSSSTRASTLNRAFNSRQTSYRSVRSLSPQNACGCGAFASTTYACLEFIESGICDTPPRPGLRLK